jgi:uncharacterized membrane protein YqjE
MEETTRMSSMGSDVHGSIDQRPTEPKRSDMSLGELFAEMSSDLSTLFRKEVELAKVEAKDEVTQLSKAGGMMAGAVAGALLTLTMLSFALAWWIDQELNTAVSFVIVGLLWAGIAAVLATVGRNRLKDVDVLPQTKETINGDVEWAKTQKS